MNVIGFAIMGYDKSRAKRHAWRVPEKRLFLISIMGGSLGTLCGMYFFRHKTKHWYFAVGLPMILIIHVGLALFITKKYLAL